MIGQQEIDDAQNGNIAPILALDPAQDQPNEGRHCEYRSYHTNMPTKRAASKNNVAVNAGCSRIAPPTSGD